MTHIDINNELLPLIGTSDKIFQTLSYDFSKANTSYEARVQATTMVASICYGSPKALGSISLFNRLQAEAAGLPSSSYEFVPVLLKLDSEWLELRTPSLKGVKDPLQYQKILRLQFHNSFKYGEIIFDEEDSSYLLSNLRALLADVGEEVSLNFTNTDQKEIDLIRDNFKVFLFNIDIATRAQMVRHRVSWQELSRRYVSGKKQEFDFYISDKLGKVKSEQEISYFKIDAHGEYEIEFQQPLDAETIINLCTSHYYAALEQGVKPEEARRILPQAMMTRIWGAFQPKQLENFLTLRLDKSAQTEIRSIAESIKELI